MSKNQFAIKNRDTKQTQTQTLFTYISSLNNKYTYVTVENKTKLCLAHSTTDQENKQQLKRKIVPFKTRYKPQKIYKRIKSVLILNFNNKGQIE